MGREEGRRTPASKLALIGLYFSNESLISLFEVNKLCKIIPSVASCQDCVKKPEAKRSNCIGDEFYRYHILDGCLD